MHYKLLYLRYDAGLTQDDMAKLIGTRTATYSEKERGVKTKSNFTLQQAKILADYFNMTIDELFFDSSFNEETYSLDKEVTSPAKILESLERKDYFKSNIFFFMQLNNIKTVTALANQTGYRYETIYRVVKGPFDEFEKTKLSILLSLCDIFGCKLSDLIEYAPNEK